MFRYPSIIVLTYFSIIYSLSSFFTSLKAFIPRSFICNSVRFRFMYPSSSTPGYFEKRVVSSLISLSERGKPSSKYFLGPYRENTLLRILTMRSGGNYCFCSMHFLTSAPSGEPVFSSNLTKSNAEISLNLNLSIKNWATLCKLTKILRFGGAWASSQQPNQSLVSKSIGFVNIHATPRATHHLPIINATKFY